MVTIDSFFNNGGVATFIDKMCAYLNITTDRMKVVGVTSGSTVVDYYVTMPVNTTADNSTTTPKDTTAEKAALQAILDKVQSAAPSSIDLGSLGPVVSSTGQLTVINTDGSPLQDTVPAPDGNQSVKTTIIVATVVSVLSVALVSVTTYLVIKKLRTRERIEPEDSESRFDDNNVEVFQEKEQHATLDLEMRENRSSLAMNQ